MAYGGKSINANGSFKSKNVYKLRKIKHIYLENFHAIYNLKLPPSLLSWNLLTCVVIQATNICRFHCITRVKRLGTLKKTTTTTIWSLSAKDSACIEYTYIFLWLRCWSIFQESKQLKYRNINQGFKVCKPTAISLFSLQLCTCVQNSIDTNALWI